MKINKKLNPRLEEQGTEEILPCGDIQPSDSGSSRIWLKIAFIGLGFLMALFVTELAFRIFTTFVAQPVRWSDRPDRFYLANIHDDIPHPNKVAAKLPGVFRILVLGDSFSFGQAMQKSDAFPARLEGLLNLASPARKSEVINWGVRGYSTSQEVALLKKSIDNLNPDLIILQITLNDPELEPYRVTHPFLDQYGRVKLDNQLLNHWKSLRFVVERIVNSQTQSSYVAYYHNLFNRDETWSPFAHNLENFKQIIDSKKIPALAVLFPLFSHAINQEYPFRNEHKKIDDYLNQLGIPAIDLKNKYQNIPAERLQVIPNVDTHPNEIAHRIAVDAIYSALKKFNLIPDEFKKIPAVRSR